MVTYEPTIKTSILETIDNNSTVFDFINNTTEHKDNNEYNTNDSKQPNK